MSNYTPERCELAGLSEYSVVWRGDSWRSVPPPAPIVDTLPDLRALWKSDGRAGRPSADLLIARNIGREWVTPQQIMVTVGVCARVAKMTLRKMWLAGELERERVVPEQPTKKQRGVQFHLVYRRKQ